MNDGLLIDNRYQVGMELGSGAFGSVYKATQLVLGRPMRDVALKLFRADAIDADNIAEQMNDALALNAILSHLTDWEIRQHFVTVYDMGLTRESKPRAYVAMELVREGSLAKRIRGLHRFSLQGTLHYLAQMVRALAFMHSEKFVHSDLKPDNILLFRHRGQDHVKIGDFGLAGKCHGLMTKEGPRGGDMAYMAPEVLQGINTQTASDVFSMGVMCYEMLTGRNPYAHVGETLTETEREDRQRMHALRIDSRAEPLRLYPSDFPEVTAGAEGAKLMPILQVINGMLEPRPDRRYHSAVEVSADLEHQLGEMLETSLHSSSSFTSRKPTVVLSSTSSDQQRRQLEAQWESAVRVANWADAERLAREHIALEPQLADGHLLLGETALRQAEVFAQSGGRAEVLAKMRSKAVRWLQEGLGRVAGSELLRIKQRLAHVYRLLNDDQAADLALNRTE
ncbi:MAG: serine/threonine-protein kinase [Planctomycetota bacterium]